MRMATAWALLSVAVLVSACLGQEAGRQGAPAAARTPAATQDRSPATTRPGIFPAAPEPLAGGAYDVPFFPGATYDPDVPTPASIIGEEVGNALRPATPAEIVQCLLAWQQHPRVKLVQIGQTHGGRPLYEVIVTSQANHDRLGEIQAGWNRLADPRGERAGDDGLGGEGLPPVAWLGYSIHGNETSGGDASLQVLYHLIAGTDEATTKLLDDLVIIIDPMLNPDGRDRYLSQQRDARARAPQPDDQDNEVVGDQPDGRTNHYFFDLNRDWIFATQPETQARIRFLRDWHPLLMVDAHEMGSQDTYLFGPGRQPINPHIPEIRIAQRRLFGDEQGAAFSEQGWRYYSGEWAEEWYPGYTDSWGAYRGAVGVLYEQSHRGAIGVRRPEGFIATHRHGVHQQAASSLANLSTLQRHRDELVRQFIEERARNVSAEAPFADRVFVFVPRGNAGREAQLAELLKLQGFEAFVADRPVTLPRAVDRLGNEVENREIPAGALVVPNRQPEGPHVSAVLEFDTRLSPAFLKLERQSLLRGEGVMMYDISAWNLPMLFDIEAYEARMDLPAGLRRLEDAEPWPAQPSAGVDRRDAKVGYVIDGRDDRSVAAAGRLMERGVEVKLATRPFKFGEREFPRGSIVISKQDNQAFDGDWLAAVDEVTRSLGIGAAAVDSGTGQALPTDEPDPVDFGGGFFRRLEPPRIALFTRGEAGNYSAGEAWHTIDQRLGLRATYLHTSIAPFADLRRYNVIILPELPAGALEPMREALDQWVKAGGTLIAIGGSASALSRAENGLGDVRRLRDVLGELEKYSQPVLRELAARDAAIDMEALYESAPPRSLEFPWSGEAEPPRKEELERRDEWQRIFAPVGVVLAGRVDRRHWLTVGVEEPLPLLAGSGTVLMAPAGVEAPVRYGVVSEGQAQPAAGGEQAATGPSTAPAASPATPAGWVSLPEGMTVRLRMSGLLWPEFAPRVAHAPYVTRQGHGSGQVILFADGPAFRAATLGTMRLLTNAMVYGPGCGADAPILP